VLLSLHLPKRKENKKAKAMRKAASESFKVELYAKERLPKQHENYITMFIKE